MNSTKQFAVVKMYHNNCLCGNRDEIIETADTLEEAEKKAADYILEGDEEDEVLNEYIAHVTAFLEVGMGDYSLCIINADDYMPEGRECEIGDGEWDVICPLSTRGECRRFVYREN